MIIRNKDPGTILYSSLFIFFLFWFFGIDLSGSPINSEVDVPSTTPMPRSEPLETQNFNIVFSGDLKPNLSRAITAILPVLPESVDQISDLLKPFLNPPDEIQKYNQSGISQLIVLAPESSLAFVRRELQAAFVFLRPALDLDLDVSIHPWSLQMPIDDLDEISLEIDAALLRTVSQLGLEENATILLMDPTGLSSLSPSSLLAFLSPIHGFLLDSITVPFGPYGAKAEAYPPISSTSEWGFNLHLQPAKYLYPPFIISSSAVVFFCDHILLLETEEQAGDTDGVSANIWPLFGSYISSFRNDSIGGLKIQPAMTPDLLEMSPPSCESTGGTPISKSRDFVFILPTYDDLLRASSLICLLLANSTRPNLLVIVYDTPLPDSNPQIEREDVWESLVLENVVDCKIPYEYLTPSSHHGFSNWFIQRFSSANSALPIHILFTVKEFTSFLPFILSQDSDIFNLTIHISIPRTDWAYTDWISTLTVAEIKNWHVPHVSLSVITGNRPRSLLRLLNSVSSALYFGDLSPTTALDRNSFDDRTGQPISLRINIEQDCDQETLHTVRNFHWPPSPLEQSKVGFSLNESTATKVEKQGSKGNLFIHHRIVHGGLLPAVVESWYPMDPLHDYGLLLEDDVEVSPLFYAWIKMCLLKYRYGDQSNKSPHMFGISLYQQKHLELPIQGRKAFNPRSLFSSFSSAGDLKVNAITPYLSQIPCSWGALYFPEHWEEFHTFLAYRLSESPIIPLSTSIVPSVRSNFWLSSWKRFFIELVYLRGYVMLYPNFEGFLSFSTNHLEPGAHVKAVPTFFNLSNSRNSNHVNSSYYLEAYKEKEKRDLFRLPLMQLPVASRSLNNVSTEMTGLLQLPEKSLPSLNSLPILNLTGYLTSQSALQNQGDQRRLALFGCNSGAQLYDVSNLLCL